MEESALEHAYRMAETLDSLVKGLQAALGSPEEPIIVTMPGGAYSVPLLAISVATGFSYSTVRAKAETLPITTEVVPLVDLEIWSENTGNMTVACVSLAALPNLIVKLPGWRLRRADKQRRFDALYSLAQQCIWAVLGEHVEQ